MAILVCRHCKGDGKIEKISRYHRKSIVRVICNNCSFVWHVSLPPGWSEDDVKKVNQNSIKANQSQEIQKSETVETAMSIAIAKAMEKQKNDKEKAFLSLLYRLLTK